MLQNVADRRLVMIVSVQHTLLYGSKIFLEAGFWPQVRTNREKIYAMTTRLL